MVTGAAQPVPDRGHLPDRLRRDLHFILAEDGLASGIAPPAVRPSSLRPSARTVALGAAAFVALAAGAATLLDRNEFAEGPGGPKLAQGTDGSSTAPSPAPSGESVGGAASDVGGRQTLQRRRALAARSGAGGVDREPDFASLEAALASAGVVSPTGVLDGNAQALDIDVREGRAEPQAPVSASPPQVAVAQTVDEAEPVAVLAEASPEPAVADLPPSIRETEPARPVAASREASPRPNAAGRRDSADAIRDLRRQW